MSLFTALNRRVRGFRIIELGATVVLTAMVLTVYLAKTGAGDKRDDIDRIQQQIQDEQTQIRLLKVEVAAEERPERLASLAGRFLNMQPPNARHEIETEALADVAQAPAPAKAGAAKAPAALGAPPAADAALLGADH